MQLNLSLSQQQNDHRIPWLKSFTVRSIHTNVTITGKLKLSNLRVTADSQSWRIAEISYRAQSIYLYCKQSKVRLNSASKFKLVPESTYKRPTTSSSRLIQWNLKGNLGFWLKDWELGAFNENASPVGSEGMQRKGMYACGYQDCQGIGALHVPFS